jgi:hypothetical protein
MHAPLTFVGEVVLDVLEGRLLCETQRWMPAAFRSTQDGAVKPF